MYLVKEVQLFSLRSLPYCAYCGLLAVQPLK